MWIVTTDTTGFLGFFIVTALNPLDAGGIHGSSEALRSFRLVVVVVVCGVGFLCVRHLGGVYLRWCPIYATRCSGRVSLTCLLPSLHTMISTMLNSLYVSGVFGS